jgi:hypothetical protein
MSRIAGVLLLVVGALLLFWGMDASESLSSEISRIFRGTPTDRTVWFLAGGTACAVAGLALLFRPGSRKKSP